MLSFGKTYKNRRHKLKACVFQKIKITMKFGPWTNLRMLNSMVLFTFSVLDWKHPFFDKLGPKNQNYLFKLKMVPKLIRIC